MEGFLSIIISILLIILSNFSIGSGTNIATNNIQTNNTINSTSSCNSSGVFDSNGGKLNCPDKSSISFALNFIKSGVKVKFTLFSVNDSEIYDTLAKEVPIAGSIKIRADLVTNPNPGKDIVGPEGMKTSITIKLKSKLQPGIILDTYLKGDSPGQWILQGQNELLSKAKVDDNSLTATFTTEKIFQTSSPVSIYIIRLPDKYSNPTINLDQIP